MPQLESSLRLSRVKKYEKVNVQGPVINAQDRKERKLESGDDALVFSILTF